MTGSGSAVMGLFRQEETARLAARELQKAYPLTFFCPPAVNPGIKIKNAV